MRFGILAVAICPILLTGCIYSRLGVEFNWLGGGSVVQTLKIDRSLVQAGGSELEKLMQGLVRRTQELGGETRRQSDSLQLSIPFKDEADFRRKANLFLGQPLAAPVAPAPPTPTLPAPVNTEPVITNRLPPVPTTATPLQLTTSDYWLWTTHRIAADLDLRVPLGATFRAVAPGLLQLEFALTTPLPASASNSDFQEGQTLIWQIEPGQLNRLEAEFVIPNVALLVLLTGVGVVLVLLWNRRRVQALR